MKNYIIGGFVHCIFIYLYIYFLHSTKNALRRNTANEEQENETIVQRNRKWHHRIAQKPPAVLQVNLPSDFRTSWTSCLLCKRSTYLLRAKKYMQPCWDRSSCQCSPTVFHLINWCRNQTYFVTWASHPSFLIGWGCAVGCKCSLQLLCLLISRQKNLLDWGGLEFYCRRM